MPKRSENVDVAIIGGGPAGMSAALWCCDLGLDCVVIERNKDLGGQLPAINNPITNYIGINRRNGRELLSDFLRSLASLSFRFELGCEAFEIDLSDLTISLPLTRYNARAIILATGVRRRKLGLPNEDQLHGRGLLYSGTGERDKVLGKRVAIIGGGDAALENAMILSQTAATIDVIHRGTTFTARKQFIDAAARSTNVQFRTGTRLSSIIADDHVTGIEIVDIETGALSKLPVDAVLIRIGVVPNTEFVAGQLQLDPDGYIGVDRFWRSSVPFVYAIGDVACRKAPTIAAAVGAGSIAAKAIWTALNEDE